MHFWLFYFESDGIFIKFKITNMAAKYHEISIYRYLFPEIINIQLILHFIFLMLLYSILTVDL